MIELRNLTKTFGDKLVLDKLSAILPDAGIVRIEGASGRGKTTLLRLLAGLIEPDAGEILGVKERRFGFVFQEDRLLPWKTALENVALVSDEATARELLDAMGLSLSLHLYPRELSGGMARRVALARGLAYSSDVLLLDEPFTGLDGENRARAAELVKSRARLIIYVSHEGADGELLPAGVCVRV